MSEGVVAAPERAQAVEVPATLQKASSEMSVSQVLHQVELVQEVMRRVMKKDEHYGVIPGTDKPTLYKAGAEKLSVTFRVGPHYEVKAIDLGSHHREYRVVCSLIKHGENKSCGQGVGSCSTMESKYRYRSTKKLIDTGEHLPGDYKKRKAEYAKQGFFAKKDDETQRWMWCKSEGKEKVENPDIADTYNTCLKMAKKRAYVDAVLSYTAASDIFCQDLEDIRENIESTRKPPQQSEGKNDRQQPEPPRQERAPSSPPPQQEAPPPPDTPFGDTAQPVEELSRNKKSFAERATLFKEFFAKEATKAGIGKKEIDTYMLDFIKNSLNLPGIPVDIDTLTDEQFNELGQIVTKEPKAIFNYCNVFGGK